MFSDLPKLLDRNFVIGYFLPAAAFVLVTFAIFFAYEMHSHWIPEDHGIWQDAPLLGILSWLVAILLMAINRLIIRGMEGYWPFRERLNWLERRRFENLERKIEPLNQIPTEDLSDQQWYKLFDLKVEMAARFPDRKDLVLPTSFGNTIRAFEAYPGKMYGLDSIGGWFRLLALTSKEYRELIDSAKAQLDFWVNVFFLSLLIIVEHIVIILFAEKAAAPLAALSKAVWLMIIELSNVISCLPLHGNFSIVWSGLTSFARLFWPVILALIIVGFAYTRAKDAAREWGEWVKSAFDVYLSELRTRLDLPRPSSREKEREMWENVSLAIYFREPERLPEKTQPAEAASLLDWLRKLPEIFNKK